MHKLYNNIGDKIKRLAMGTFILETIGAIVTGIVLICEVDTLSGLLTLFCGPIVAYFLSWILYGFGELINKICVIAQNTNPATTPKSSVPSPSRPKTKLPHDDALKAKNIKNAKTLRDTGLITDEEYNQIYNDIING